MWSMRIAADTASASQSLRTVAAKHTVAWNSRPAALGLCERLDAPALSVAADGGDPYVMMPVPLWAVLTVDDGEALLHFFWTMAQLSDFAVDAAQVRRAQRSVRPPHLPHEP